MYSLCVQLSFYLRLQVSTKAPVADDHFYAFPLPLEKIHWIDESSDFDNCVTRLSVVRKIHTDSFSEYSF